MRPPIAQNVPRAGLTIKSLRIHAQLALPGGYQILQAVLAAPPAFQGRRNLQRGKASVILVILEHMQVRGEVLSAAIALGIPILFLAKMGRRHVEPATRTIFTLLRGSAEQVLQGQNV